MIKGIYEAHLPVSNISKSVEFYSNLGLELAHQGEAVTFFWIEKGKSWLGLWETDKVETPYHPSLRHIAFHVELNDLIVAKEWLEQRGIGVRKAFGFEPKQQPIVLPNNPQSHAALYFKVLYGLLFLITYSLQKCIIIGFLLLLMFCSIF
ncbi:VOC family protein [Aquibacillus sediminis]|uniref:VOC family protein n=1 Tax=Aquibacillus sediminis TaxID=2574734 RepID=UPI001109D129|nr:VOC family protein [Aquibacillus sediminis]